ncbi:tRNA pseudouridine synthase A isoform X1 [Maniola jurtina]|uniref:tRNA pseudouridine synthase A isoform X1 n=2 Tax=Maniola jurtina TaxID=191418 RepID=UPI001E68DA7E|nr:tRNA pseudouridine synthase A isoform X1 [Maniola jurtina]
MSVQLFKLLVNSVRQRLPRPSILSRSGLQIRSIAVMEVVKDRKDESDTKEELVQDKKHTRYKRRFLKRQWEDSGDGRKENDASGEKKVCDKPFERIKRKKVAMLLGYCGVDYYGMQRNPGVPTIEEDLLKALFDAKYITEEDFTNQQNAQFQRSSRTDKGVSAARQVVSLKLPLEVNIDEINSRLPPCIKVFGIKRATNKFNSKSKCNARTYSYTLPTYVFEPSLSETERKTYRISAEKMTKVNEVLSVYRGTKSYHNFTEKKHYQDPSSLRYMMSFSLERVFIESEMEFAELLVKGQSFMLHQIRKMVGLMIAVVRGQTDMGMMEKVFGKDKVMIPTAPGLGLLLDKVHYERYDAKFKGSHDSLTWDAEDEAVETFKRDRIFPYIIQGEIEGNSMGLWLEKIKRHSFEPSDDVPDDKNDIGDTGGDDDDDNDDICDDGDDNTSKDFKGDEVNGVTQDIEDNNASKDIKADELKDITRNIEENNTIKDDRTKDIQDVKDSHRDAEKLIDVATPEKNEKIELNDAECEVATQK